MIIIFIEIYYGFIGFIVTGLCGDCWWTVHGGCDCPGVVGRGLKKKVLVVSFLFLAC